MSVVQFRTAGNLCENRALEILKQEILQTLNLRNLVIDYYFQETHLSLNLHDEILSIESKHEQNAAFLEEVLRSGTVEVFLQALEFRDTHTELARNIRNFIHRLKRNNPGCQPRRIYTQCSKHRRLVKFNHKLREITSAGKDCEQKLLNITSSMKRMCRGDKDIYFHMLDAEAAFYRVFYKQNGFQTQESILNEMELCWRSTSYPENSLMVYLARKGSFLASKGDLETGMQFLVQAKELSDKFQPCKETGMVRFIVVNLLLQSYKQTPTQDTKRKIIKEIIHSIDQDFAAVTSEQVRVDYTKMMYLKLAFCVLGIGCFCEVIPDCQITEADRTMAKESLRRIDELPGHLYKKHLMFHSFIKSALGDRSQALQDAMKASHIAKQCRFESELKNVNRYLETLYGKSVQEQVGGT